MIQKIRNFGASVKTRIKKIKYAAFDLSGIMVIITGVMVALVGLGLMFAFLDYLAEILPFLKRFKFW